MLTNRRPVNLGGRARPASAIALTCDARLYWAGSVTVIYRIRSCLTTWKMGEKCSRTFHRARVSSRCWSADGSKGVMVTRNGDAVKGPSIGILGQVRVLMQQTIASACCPAEACERRQRHKNLIMNGKVRNTYQCRCSVSGSMRTANSGGMCRCCCLTSRFRTTTHVGTVHPPYHHLFQTNTLHESSKPCPANSSACTIKRSLLASTFNAT